MNFLLSHCEASDAPELARVHYAIFSHSLIYRVMYSNANPNTIIEKYERFFVNGINEQAKPTMSREVHYLKITDAATDKIIAYVTWIFIPNGYDAAKDPQTSVDRLPAGSNLPVAHEFKRVIGKVRGEDEERKGPHFRECLS